MTAPIPPPPTELDALAVALQMTDEALKRQGREKYQRQGVEPIRFVRSGYRFTKRDAQDMADEAYMDRSDEN